MLDDPFPLPAIFLVAVCSFASLAFWIWFLGHRATTGRWPKLLEAMRRDQRGLVPWTAGDLVMILLFFVVATITASHFLGDIAGKSVERFSTEEMTRIIAVQSIAAVVTLAAAFAWLRFSCGADDVALGLPTSRRGTLFDVMLGVVGFFVAFAPVFGVQWLTSLLVEYEHQVIEILRERSGYQLWIAATITTLLIAPIAEEFAFRLLLQGWVEKTVAKATLLKHQLRRQAAADTRQQPEGGDDAESPSTASGAAEDSADRKLQPEEDAQQENAQQDANPYQSPESNRESAKSDVELPVPPVPLSQLPSLPPSTKAIPVVASSLAFALAHLGQGLAPVPLFLLGLVLGFLYQRTGRLLPCIVLHAVFNGYSMLVLMFLIGSR